MPCCQDNIRRRANKILEAREAGDEWREKLHETAAAELAGEQPQRRIGERRAAPLLLTCNEPPARLVLADVPTAADPDPPEAAPEAAEVQPRRSARRPAAMELPAAAAPCR